MDKVLKDFVDTYLTPADKLRFSRELCEYPRKTNVRYKTDRYGNYKLDKKGKKIQIPFIEQVNTEAFIAEGSRTYLSGSPEDHPDDRKETRYYPTKLDVNNYSRIRSSINREFGDLNKYWHFLKYASDAWVDWFAVDIDDHHEEDDKWSIVRKLDSLGLPILYTRSVGRGNNGEIHGFYAHVYLTAPVMLLELQPIVHQIRHILNEPKLEFPGTIIQDKGFTTNFRFPFQYNCNIVQLDTDNEICIPLIKQASAEEMFAENLALFNKRQKIELPYIHELLETSNVNSSKELFENVSSGGVCSIRRTNKVSNQVTKPRQHNVSTGFQFNEHNGGYTSASNATVNSPGTGNSISGAEPNAFTRITKIVSSIFRERRGAGQELDYLSEATQRFIDASLPHGFVDHVNNPDKLNALVSKSIHYFHKTFNPNKLIPLWRIDKDKQDQIRFERILSIIANIGEDRFFRMVKRDSNITVKQLHKLREFWQLCKKYNGRVSAKCIYNHNGTNPNAPFSNAYEWKTMVDILVNVGILLNPTKNEETAFSVAKKTCNQWLFNEHCLSSFSDTCNDVDTILNNNNSLFFKKQYMSNTSIAANENSDFHAADNLDNLIDSIFSQKSEMQEQTT